MLRSAADTRAVLSQLPPGKQQTMAIDLTSAKNQPTLQFRFELHPRLVVCAFVFTTTTA